MREKIKDYIRVLKIAKRPSMEEYKQIAKLSGLGVVGMGLIGLLVTLVFTVFHI